ncbi:hypothetical protein TU66_00005, partial [Bacillus cereus]
MAVEPIKLLSVDTFLEEGVPIINDGIKQANRSLTEMDESRNGYKDLKTRLSQSDVNLMNNPGFSTIPEYYEKAESINLVLTNSG